MRKQEAKQWAKMLSAPQPIADVVPDGWRTAKEIAAEIRRSQSYASKMLNRLVSEGKLQRRKFRILTGSKMYPVDHYKDA